MATTNFSAKEPSLGYYYQIRLSLYLLLRAKDKTNPCMKLENLDDITVEDVDGINLYQTKLHINSVANLTDRSSDFWKTIRVWSEAIKAGLIDPDNALFTLITTATIPEDSFIYNFNTSNPKPNLETALSEMQSISMETSNLTNLPGYNAFKSLDLGQQKKLLKNIVCLDASLSIEEALISVKNELLLAAPVGKIDLFVEYIEGWWFQQCISILTEQRDSITMSELNKRISDIRDTFQADNLPDDFADPIRIDEDELQTYEDKIFVKQLKLIAVRNTMLLNAISDFRRAYEQRSKWLREDLANIEEFDYFEKQLSDHWRTIFSIIKDDCDDLEDAELERIGKEFYIKYYVQTVPPFKIRDRFQSQYLTRGSCHMLSDEKRIGWHPNFEELVEQ